MHCYWINVFVCAFCWFVSAMVSLSCGQLLHISETLLFGFINTRLQGFDCTYGTFIGAKPRVWLGHPSSPLSIYFLIFSPFLLFLFHSLALPIFFFRPCVFLQCVDTVGWVIWPVKPVPDMTYNVFGWTLSLTQSINQSRLQHPLKLPLFCIEMLGFCVLMQMLMLLQCHVHCINVYLQLLHFNAIHIEP